MKYYHNYTIIFEWTIFFGDNSNQKNLETNFDTNGFWANIKVDTKVLLYLAEACSCLS